MTFQSGKDILSVSGSQKSKYFLNHSEMIYEGLSKQITSLSSSNVLGMKEVQMLMVGGICSIFVFEVFFQQMFHIRDHSVRKNIYDGVYFRKAKNLHCIECSSSIYGLHHRKVLEQVPKSCCLGKKNKNRTIFTHHQHLYFLHSWYVGRTKTSYLLRQSFVNHPTMVEKIFKFLASRHRQNVFPRLKGHNQNYVSWRTICDMLKS